MNQIQVLLDKEAELGNRRYYILQQIKAQRGTQAPPCWGMDDCSTLMLSQCPWRIDCGEHESQVYQEQLSLFCRDSSSGRAAD
jgi:hypothetical protein